MKTSVRERLLARPSSDGTFTLTAVDPSKTPGISKAKALRDLSKEADVLADLQERLFAEGKRSLLLVLQGMDASGKDGTVKHVIRAMNPSGCRITSFKQPTPEERKHNFLWRIRKALPQPAYVGVFNRSHYEDVGVVRVHGLVPPRVWRARYAEINRFEQGLVRRKTTVVKVFLHISPEEQRRRLLARLDDPTKHWKFNEGDIHERGLWDHYMAAYDDAIARCSTNAAPWYVVPSDHKWYRNWAIAHLLIETLREMDPRYPEPDFDIEALEERIKNS